VASLNTRVRPAFIPELHAFRGFAIINIAAIHCWVEAIHFLGRGPAWPGDRYLAAVNEALFHGSTLYFALISGLLYSAVLRDHAWPTFFRRKLTNVVVPYVIFTTALTAMNWPPPDGSGGDLSGFAVRVVAHLLNGSAMYHLWYIPVLVLLYLSTPLIAVILEHAKAKWLIYPLMLVPLVSPRVWPQFSWITYLYFLGAYCVGIYLGRSYAAKMELVVKWKTPILATAIVMTALLVYAYIIGWSTIAGLPFRESLFYLQKISIAVLILVLLRAQGEGSPRVLDPLATYAFTIYFLHALLIYWFRVGLNGLDLPSPGLAGTVLWGGAFLVASVALSVIFAVIVRRVLGKWSRPLIGT